MRDSDQFQEMIKSQTALNRVGYADDIGGIIAFLCTDDAKWITAQRIEASGGIYIYKSFISKNIINNYKQK